MKKVLVTAKNSYIGSSFAEWTKEDFEIDLISCRTKSWEKLNFSKFDCVLHVAGIAHINTNPNMEAEYYKVNKDLTIELAKKAKSEGVKQFIFMSSIIVYGDNLNLNKKIVIDRKTKPMPSNYYGKSKLEAEEGISCLQDESFNVVIIRTPMVYGNESKGNYRTLKKIAEKTPVFPDIENERSMIHTDNLSEFIKLMIFNNESGIFYPQNKEFVNTSGMVKSLAQSKNKKILMTTLANPLIYLLSKKVKFINKAFGSLIYEKSISTYKENYQIKE